MTRRMSGVDKRWIIPESSSEWLDKQEGHTYIGEGSLLRGEDGC